jgi:hypothetical protein
MSCTDADMSEATVLVEKASMASGLGTRQETFVDEVLRL